jgi:hypothetical protein
MDDYARPTGMLGMLLCCVVIASKGYLQSNTLCQLLKKTGQGNISYQKRMI